MTSFDNKYIYIKLLQNSINPVCFNTKYFYCALECLHVLQFLSVFRFVLLHIHQYDSSRVITHLSLIVMYHLSTHHILW